MRVIFHLTDHDQAAECIRHFRPNLNPVTSIAFGNICTVGIEHPPVINWLPTVSGNFPFYGSRGHSHAKNDCNYENLYQDEVCLR